MMEIGTKIVFKITNQERIDLIEVEEILIIITIGILNSYFIVILIFGSYIVLFDLPEFFHKLFF